jgi:site-specific recombinase XerD
MRLSALIEEFLVDCRSRRLSPKTVSWYQANLRYFLDWLLAHDRADALQAFTLTNARRYIQELAERMARQGIFVGGAPRRGV